jgi:hypothetical protein
VRHRGFGLQAALQFAAEPLASLGAADRRQLWDLLQRMLSDQCCGQVRRIAA